MCSSVRRHQLLDPYCSRVPRSVKRRSLSMLPDATVPDTEPDTEDRAFVEQVCGGFVWPVRKVLYVLQFPSQSRLCFLGTLRYRTVFSCSHCEQHIYHLSCM